MEGAYKNDRKIKISNGPETVKEGTPRGDTTTNLLFVAVLFGPDRKPGKCEL